MTLKYQLDSLDGLDDGIKSLYKQGEDGKFTLPVDGVVPKSEFDAINQKAVDNANEAFRRRKTVERVTGMLGLDDASSLDDALTELMSKAKNPPKGESSDNQGIIEQIKAKAAADVDAANARVSQYVQKSAQAEVKAAIAQAGFHSEAVDMVALQAMSRVKVDADKGEWYITKPDGTGPLAGSGSNGNATAIDLAKELAAAMPTFLQDTGKGGGGKPPASGAKGGTNTVTRSQFDAMDQSERFDFTRNGGKVTKG